MAIEIRKGTREDLESFIHLLQSVQKEMDHKEWFYVDPPEDFREMAENGILELWVAMDADRMAAAFDILIPQLEEYNYGYDLGFSQSDLMRVVNMDSVAVHPDYRGMGLQKKLMQCAEAYVKEMGNRILLCTVHPDNQFSLHNILQQGYSIERRLEKYGSVRFILRKDI